MSLIVLMAAPNVRELCSEEYIEGKWVDVPSIPEKIEAGALLAKPTGKYARREDLMSAPIFEFRNASDWGDTVAREEPKA